MRLARVQGEPFNELEMPLGTPKRAVEILDPPKFCSPQNKRDFMDFLWISYGYVIDILRIFYGCFMDMSYVFFGRRGFDPPNIYIYKYGFVERLISVALVGWRLPRSKFSS
jgi:hypothetical protein